jgi:uncharacterized protein YegL
MPYEILATSMTPALIIYLIDVSASMSRPLGSERRIEVVTKALTAALQQMIFRSTKGGRLSPRYRIAMFAYSDKVYDVLDGVRGIDEVAKKGVPQITTMRTTETAKAFRAALRVLETEIPKLSEHPAPVVCHLTDGEFTGEDPRPVVEKVKELHVPDGRVLVENIFISDEILKEPVQDARHWKGVLADTALATDYAKMLRDISSPVPDSYRVLMLEMGFNITERALMMIPGTNSELVELGFQMSAATRVR